MVMLAVLLTQYQGLSHPTPAPQPNLKDSSSEIPSGSLETLSGRPTSSLMRMVRKRSETPTPTTTIYVPAASSSLYNIKQTPI